MKYLFTFALFIVCWRGSTQLPDYYVDLVTGSVTITRPGSNPVPAKQKLLVYKNDKITIAKGAELTLVDRDAGFFVVNAAGTNTAGDLVRRSTRKTKDGVTSGYMKLLFHELLDPNQDFDKFKKENIAGVWGGVSRSDDCGNRLLPIDGFKTSGQSINFRWRKTSPGSNYSLEIYDHDNKPVSKTSVRDTALLLNVGEALHNNKGIYKWRITSEDGKCEDEMPIYFEVLTPENEQKLITQFLPRLSNLSLENQMQQVDKLEKNGLIDAAAARYASMVKAYPLDKPLMKSYVAFLLKYGFDQEARSAWKP